MSRPGPKIPPLSVTDVQRAVPEGWSRRRTTAPASGPSLHRRHKVAEFEKFLAKLDKEVPAGLQVHLILDDYATHKTPDIKKCC